MNSQEKIQSTSGTLCWTCKWAAGKDGKCPWVREFKPVEGWKATPDQVLITSATQAPDGVPKYTDSFTVIECPLYEEAPEVTLHRKIMEKIFADQMAKEKVDEIEAELERLWIVEHKSNDEIAAELGIPICKLYKIKRKIKERYENGK